MNYGLWWAVTDKWPLPSPSDDGVFGSSFLTWVWFEDDGSIGYLKQGSANWSSADGKNWSQLDKVIGRLWHAWVVIATTIDPEETGIWASDCVRYTDAQEMPPNWSIGHSGYKYSEQFSINWVYRQTWFSTDWDLTVEPSLRCHVDDVQGVVGQLESLKNLILVSGIRSVDVIVQGSGASHSC